MAETLQDVEQRAMQLSEDERAQLAHKLILSLEPYDPAEHGTPKEIEEAWRVECERRLAAYDRGEVQAISGEEVRARVRRHVK
jgi:putative addiction module component (TIGR02574 family)